MLVEEHLGLVLPPIQGAGIAALGRKRDQGPTADHVQGLSLQVRDPRHPEVPMAWMRRNQFQAVDPEMGVKGRNQCSRLIPGHAQGSPPEEQELVAVGTQMHRVRMKPAPSRRQIWCLCKQRQGPAGQVTSGRPADPVGRSEGLQRVTSGDLFAVGTGQQPVERRSRPQGTQFRGTE